jgi:hypothetical protein
MWVIDQDTRANAPVGCAVSKEDIVASARGRGLRLIYDECLSYPDFHLGSEGDAKLHAATRGFPLRNGDFPAYYNLTLRFAAAHATGDGIDDAHSCFETMRALFDSSSGMGEFSKWRTDFAKPPLLSTDKKDKLEHIGGDRPRDCGAMVLVMQDWADGDDRMTNRPTSLKKYPKGGTRP